MRTSVIGYPRIGALRELKFATEKYFRKEITEAELLATAKNLRRAHWEKQAASAIDFIPSNDFSFYDAMLDTALLLNVVPARYRAAGLSPLDTLFALARGYQGERGDVKALSMKKWFNTNYHYLVPEIEDDAEIKIAARKPFDEFAEARALGIATKPVLPGPFTFLKLARFVGKKTAADFVTAICAAYENIFAEFAGLGAEWIQLDEPSLVTDLAPEEISRFKEIYTRILAKKSGLKILLQTYFGDVRDCAGDILALPFDGVGIDFVEGKLSLDLFAKKPFPQDKILFAGLVNGKNIHRNDYGKTLSIFRELKATGAQIVVSTSCSLLHVPYTLANETKLPEDTKKHLAFAEEKLGELAELKRILAADLPKETREFKANAALISEAGARVDKAVRERAAKLRESDFVRLPAFAEREKIQHERFGLPLLPTTTIGSFPQTRDVREARSRARKKEISQEEYKNFLRGKIERCVRFQEKIGLDVLVHGEYERNDMVEYFGECLDGYIFTEKGWVQSYGTRCVKPPIVHGDVSRKKPMTVEWSAFAQSLTGKPMKGMLTGPITILNWSFPREDISLKESATQIALAIRDEVLDLEKAGIKIIQIDEAALREKLPLRKADWHKEYLDWAIPVFRLTHSGVAPQTQIHTHMCYSEFADIIREIDAMDADVITFEAARSDLSLLAVLNANHFRTEVGPGVYDIHSPRVPAVEEIKAALRKMLAQIPQKKLWVNPDCGLKTRGEPETESSLENLVAAARAIRDEIC